MIVAALAALCVAIVGLLVLFAYAPLIRSISQSLGASLPGALGWLADALNGLEVRVSFDAYQWALASVSPLRDAFLKFSDEARGLLSTAYDLAGTLTHLVNRIVTEDLPATLGAARAYSDQVQLHSDQLAAQDLAAATAHTDQVAQELRDLTALDYAYARGHADDLAVDLQSQIGDARNAAIAAGELAAGRAIDVARGVELEALRGIEAGVKQAEAYADSQARTAGAYADQVGAGARSYADRLGLEEHRYTDQQVGRAATLAAGALSVVATAVRELEQSRCMQRCDTLGALGEAIELIDLGLILGLLEQARHDPAGATETVRKELVPLVSELEAGALALLGLGG